MKTNYTTIYFEESGIELETKQIDKEIKEIKSKPGEFLLNITYKVTEKNISSFCCKDQNNHSIIANIYYSNSDQQWLFAQDFDEKQKGFNINQLIEIVDFLEQLNKKNNA